MSDTPETDNERTLKLALEVFTELAKTLKQERDEAVEDCKNSRQSLGFAIDVLEEAQEQYNNLATEHMLAINKLATERDDARQLADRLTALELQSTSELARLERERDEAVEEVRLLKGILDVLIKEAQ